MNARLPFLLPRFRILFSDGSLILVQVKNASDDRNTDRSGKRYERSSATGSAESSVNVGGWSKLLSRLMKADFFRTKNNNNTAYLLACIYRTGGFQLGSENR